MAGKFGVPALISIALVLLDLAAFVVLLGGAAALQKNGATIVTLVNALNSSPDSPGLLAYGDLKPRHTQGNFISYEWFKAVFQVLTLLFALGVLATGQIYRFRIALVALLAALGVFFADSSDTFYYLYLQTHTNSAVPSNIQKAIIAWFSGCVATAALNFLLVISLGSSTGERTPVANYQSSPVPGTKDTHNGGAV